MRIRRLFRVCAPCRKIGDPQLLAISLIRRFVGFSERDGPAGELGAELLDYAGIIFEYWHLLKGGVIDRDRFRELMAPAREQFEETLQRIVDADMDGMSGSCADMLEHQPALWNFVDREDVDPTNNAAERALRTFVLWRRRCFGSKSARGDRFAERIVTLHKTACKQGLNSFQLLAQLCQAQRDGTLNGCVVAELTTA